LIGFLLGLSDLGPSSSKVKAVPANSSVMTLEITLQSGHRMTKEPVPSFPKNSAP